MRTVLAVLVAATLAACGIQPSGVVDAGQPAEGVAAGGSVYLIGGSGQVEAVQRAGLSGGDPQAAVESLLAGPDEFERAAGFRTALPDGAKLIDLQLVKTTLVATLSVDPTGLSDLALTQLGCTIIAIPGAKLDTSTPVLFIGAGGPFVQAPDCPAL